MNASGNPLAKKPLFALILATFLSGCSLIPEFERPSSPTPSAWPQGPSYRDPIEGTVISEMDWRVFFSDERLKKLIDLGLENNRDLRIAALNIERARAMYQIQHSALFPEIDASGGMNAQRLPKTVAPYGQSSISRQYTATVGMTAYEIDIFGRIRSLQEQALEQYLATEETRNSVQISLIAQIAYAYLTLSADTDRLQLAKETLVSQSESYQLTKRSYDLGIASELDLRQAQTTVDSARVEVARYTHIVAQDENLLALLIGTNEVPKDLLPNEPLHDVTSVTELPSGLPSEVLLQRPDIMAAEHMLLAANANIGAARAAFYPRITLTAAGGLMSGQLSKLFDSGSGTWSFAPFISLPIFDGGYNEAVLETAKVDREISIAQYEQAIQIAFREVADALADYGMLDDQLKAQESLTEARKISYELSEIRFRKGIDSYLSTLDSQRMMYLAQQELILTRLTRQTAFVTLYKTLGGGWKAPSVD